MTPSRRDLLNIAAAGAAAAISDPLAAEEAPMTAAGGHAFVFDGLDGAPLRLSAFRGRPLLVVNTASHCGYTPQYRDLQEIWTRFRDKGLVVVGVPSNDFGGQEPGSDKDIAAFCAGAYGVSFPMAAKQVVVGEDAHPFYRWAARLRPLDTPRWNFHKYLVGRDGQLAAAFPSAVRPTDPRVIAAIEAELPGS